MKNRRPRILGVSRDAQEKHVAKVEISIMQADVYQNGAVVGRGNVVGTFSSEGRTVIDAIEESMMNAVEFINRQSVDESKSLAVLIEDENAANAAKLTEVPRD